MGKKIDLDPRIELLLKALDEGYSRKAWHGPNLRGSIRGLSERQASWRPASKRHNIREVVVHAAYWKYAVRRRLLGGKRGAFPLRGSNWFTRPSGEDAFGDAVVLLEQEHRKLREAVSGFPPERLSRSFPNARATPADIILGIAFHDVYHAAQIQLLKRLQGKAN
ncbi:DinB family protein [Acidobacteria bacterium AH-259-L09]|nr:DinB family protein [Acidobacteria bacterium AH-259-L09]